MSRGFAACMYSFMWNDLQYTQSLLQTLLAVHVTAWCRADITAELSLFDCTVGSRCTALRRR